MFVITGGGTGGHLAIAKALALELKGKKKTIYIGSLQGQDRDWFEGSDLFEKVYFLNTTGVVNKRGLGIFKALFLQLKALLVVRRIFKEYGVESVISVGGFSAGPASIGALIFGKKLFIHEQNAIKGKLNAKLSPYAKRVFGSFGERADNFMHTSYPVREEFFAKSRVRDGVKSILFLGGSQGALALNNFALKVAPSLLDRGFKILHQCGARDFARMKTEYENLGILERVDLFDFSPELLGKMVEADCCVCRAGASSVWEAAANGLPCLYVPYPYAAQNHQYHNALFFEKRDLGMIVKESNLTPQVLEDFITNLEGNITEVSARLRESIKNDGAAKIVEQIILLS